MRLILAKKGVQIKGKIVERFTAGLQDRRFGSRRSQKDIIQANRLLKPVAPKLSLAIHHIKE